jgi:hypothetical protein
MKYLLLICTEGPVRAEPADLDPRPWIEMLEGRGARLEGGRLESPETATTVRVRDGSVLVTDGPFADTKEQMGGLDIIDCADLDEAIEIASKHPMARFGMIEVRPFWSP